MSEHLPGHKELLRPEEHPQDYKGFVPREDRFKSKGFIGLFARHKVAPNLMMLVMILAGIVALMKLNVQFFPNFELDYATVQVVWPGANAEDVETSITNPVERVLRNIDNLDEMTSTSALGIASVTLKFNEGTNMIEALDQIKQKVSELRSLPQDIQKPIIQRITRYEPVAKLVLTSDHGSVSEMRVLARKYEQELLDSGIDKVKFTGLPADEMSVEVSQNKLEHYGLTLTQVGDRLASMSRDIPAGSVGDHDAVRDIRAIQQARTVNQFKQIPIINLPTEQVRLGDIATIEKLPKKKSPDLKVDGVPAIQMEVMRAESGDTLKSAKVVQTWLAKTRPSLPKGMHLQVYNQTWNLVHQRIMLLVNNGISGLILVVLILYIFMNGRVAFWVAVGIPVSFMATLMVLYLAGGSINMVSLFGLIMALGIIVDDAIVVGEDALAHHEMGEPPLQATEGGAHRMLAPVVASSLTTVGAFLPLMMIGGEMGNILFAIPLVIIAVIFASLLESFTVLPGHLRHAFAKVKPSQPGSIRYRLDQAIDHWRNVQFRQVIRWSLAHRAIVIASTVAMMIFAVGLLAGGRMAFVFFPSPESTKIIANVEFVSGTQPSVVKKYMTHLYQTLESTEKQLEPGIIKMAVVHYNEAQSKTGSNFGQINIELKESDQRKTRNTQFIKLWKQKAGVMPGLETLSISSPRTGPPGGDIDIRLWGASARQLKKASVDLQQVLSQITGVSSVQDDLPFGRDQMVYHLTPRGLALGFTYANLGGQLSSAFSGRLVQIYTQGEDEVEVRVQYPRKEQFSYATLGKMQVSTPQGQKVPLSSVATWTDQRGFDAIRHVDGRFAVTVVGDVDKTSNNANRILDQLQ
jgi:multidrug efflux pump subunit AcrB